MIVKIKGIARIHNASFSHTTSWLGSIFISSLSSVLLLVLPCHAVDLGHSCTEALNSISTAQVHTLLSELAQMRTEIARARKSNAGALAYSLSRAYQKKLDDLHTLGLSPSDSTSAINQELNLVAEAHALDQELKVKTAEVLENKFRPYIVRTTLRHHGDVFSYLFDPKGEKIVTYGMSNRIEIWDAKSGAQQHLFRLGSQYDSPSSVVFGLDGKKLLAVAVAVAQNNVAVWDLNSQTKIAEKVFDQANIDATFNADATGVLIRSHSDVSAWDLKFTKKIYTLGGDVEPISLMAVSPKGKTVLSKHLDIATVSSLDTGKSLFQITSAARTVNEVDFTEDGQKFAITDADKHTAALYDARTGNGMQLYSIGEKTVAALRFSPNGRLILIKSKEGIAILFDVVSGLKIREFGQEQRQINSADFSPDSSRLVTTYRNGTVFVWDLDFEAPLYQYADQSNLASDAKFSPDGAALMISNSKRTLILTQDRAEGTR